MRIMVATNNEHKLRELAAILSEHTLVTPREAGVAFDFDETGTTFEENAIGKARALNAILAENPGSPAVDAVIADDSGICVDALDGAPGIYSARYGSPDGGSTELSAPERNQLLLNAVGTTENRGAAFVCCMVALFSRDRYVIAQERWAGSLATEASRAQGGFGYDPIFVVPGHNCTASELPEEEKNRLSHRGRAARVLAAALRAAVELP